MNKSLFITIAEGAIVRNILRAGALDLLKKEGFRIIIFVACKALPANFEEEFSDDRTTIIPIKKVRVSRLHRVLILFSHYVIWNATTKRYFRFGQHYVNSSRIIVAMHIILLRIISVLPLTKRFIRWSELRFVHENPQISDYFSTFRPNLVFATSITSTIDNVFLAEARRRKITTVAMPKSWDNVTKMFLRNASDFFIVQNEILKSRLAELQRVPLDRISVSGFPQFDWYSDATMKKSRSEHFRSMGLDENRKMIFFASQGSWFPDDYRIAELIARWIEHDELADACQLVVRPHFTNAKESKLSELRNRPHVIFDDQFTMTELFSDRWDPSVDEYKNYLNTVMHADVIVVVLSTIALDAAAADRPVINALFWSKFRQQKDITFEMKKTEHYGWVFATHGTSVVVSPDELRTEINNYLRDPHRKQNERKELRDQLCFRVDGKSSERIASKLREVMEKHTTV